MSKRKHINNGDRFGRLVAIDRSEYRRDVGHVVKCKCDCGSIRYYNAHNLRRGHTNSCGCLQRDRATESSTKHGLRSHRIYKIFMGMKDRCENKNNIEFGRYGGRGIRICNEWRNDVKRFYDWSIKNGYSDSKQLDRIDNNKGYGEDNCRWITPKENQNNKSSNMIVMFGGVRMSLSDAVKKSGTTVSYRTVWQRIKRDGKTFESAIK